jgi:fructosamine-3-kinase
MDAALRSAIEDELGSRVQRAERQVGGSIDDAYLAELVDGRRVFVKTHARLARGVFSSEARGLSWLRDAAALRVPDVLAVAEPDRGRAYLVLEYLEPRRRARDFDERLGAGLAALHRAGAPSFGLEHPNFVGSLEQDNSAAASWSEFYRDRRIAPLLRRASESRALPDAVRRAGEQLLADIVTLVGPEEAPARLHGDLWRGNVISDERGAPCLIDPAAYGGCREIDLAMMRLFGGFDQRTFAAYEASFPLAPGSASRIALYQLYPLLVHVCLFGASYVEQLAATMARARG